MSEYIFVHLLDKQSIGANLGNHIPLHMTVLHWFKSQLKPNELIDITTSALLPIGIIAVKATYEDMFGPNNDIPVMRLNIDPKLVDLHLNLLQAMQDHGSKINDRWSGELDWNPHVSHKPDLRLYPGDEVLINDIDLICRPNKNGNRTILHRFLLNN